MTKLDKRFAYGLKGVQMFPAIYTTGMQVDMNYVEPISENMEDYGQKHGTVVTLPSWGDSLTLRVGQQLITIGQKMTASSLQHMQLSRDLR